jgi:hypothetical protein
MTVKSINVNVNTVPKLQSEANSKWYWWSYGKSKTKYFTRCRDRTLITRVRVVRSADLANRAHSLMQLVRSEKKSTRRGIFSFFLAAPPRCSFAQWRGWWCSGSSTVEAIVCIDVWLLQERVTDVLVKERPHGGPAVLLSVLGIGAFLGPYRAQIFMSSESMWRLRWTSTGGVELEMFSFRELLRCDTTAWDKLVIRVEPSRGVDPRTFSLRMRCSNHWAMRAHYKRCYYCFWPHHHSLQYSFLHCLAMLVAE